MVNGLKLRAHVYEYLPAVDLCKDPDDNPVLAMALESKAGFLVTGDKRDLLSMVQVGQTPIVSAATLLKQLESY